jgi:hypothetical protein
MRNRCERRAVDSPARADAAAVRRAAASAARVLEHVAHRLALAALSDAARRAVLPALVRLQRGGAAHLQVWPYAFTPSPQATLALRTLLADAFGARVGLGIAPTVAYGGEDDVALAVDPVTTHGLVLFDLNATPEAETHGRFIQRVAAALPAGAAIAVLIDEATFRQRFGALSERITQRQNAWRACCESLGLTTVFVDLDAGAVPAFEALLRGALVAQDVVGTRSLTALAQTPADI